MEYHEDGTDYAPFPAEMKEKFEPQPEERSDEQIPAVVGTSSSTTELLHCPFCNSNNDILIVRTELCSHVFCRQCGCRGPLRIDKTEAIKAWNNRA